MSDWYGVDLDCTIARYDSGDFRKYGWAHIGEPIPSMVDRVKKMIENGLTVKIFTARVSEEDPELRAKIIHGIQDWTERHIGRRLDVTNVKDYNMIELYDDRAKQVESNTGRVIGEDA